MFEKALAHRWRALAPGGVELACLARAPALARERRRHPLAVINAGARHGHEVLHGHVRGDLSLAHLLLDRLRQDLHERQPARDPAHIAIEAPGQRVQVIAEAPFELGQEPALLERRLLLCQAQRSLQHQRFGLAHWPDHRVDRVPAQLPQSRDALEAVDDQIVVRLIGHGDHHDRRLLARLGQ